MDEPDSLASKLEAEIERKLSHERFRSPRRVGERPLDRKLADFLVVRVAVGAAAVVEVAADRVVVVAVDRRNVPGRDHGADLVWMRSVSDEVTAAVDRPDAKLGDSLECGVKGLQIRV
jgi:hypothetical protein